MSLCKGLAVYNQIKKLTTGECTPALEQKKPAAQEGLKCFKLYFDSQVNTPDLRFGKLGFESHFEIFQPSRQGSYD